MENNVIFESRTFNINFVYIEFTAVSYDSSDEGIGGFGSDIEIELEVSVVVEVNVTEVDGFDFVIECVNGTAVNVEGVGVGNVGVV